MQAPVSGSQVPDGEAQTLSGVLQTRGVPTQRPSALQVSERVQGSRLLQARPTQSGSSQSSRPSQSSSCASLQSSSEAAQATHLAPRQVLLAGHVSPRQSAGEQPPRWQVDPGGQA